MNLAELANHASRETVATAAQAAAAFGVSEWSWRESAKDGTCPVPVIRIGRRTVWSWAQILTVLGVELNGSHDP
jgi:hypothetical protein